MRPGLITVARQWVALQTLRQRRRLMLNRDIRQELLIDNKILITIEGRRGGGFAVSIRAPREVIVVRGEVIERDIERLNLSPGSRDVMQRMVDAAVKAADLIPGR